MKIKRGNYEGASRFAYFDKEISAMSDCECRSLLQAILHRAMPGEDNAEVVLGELGIAEEICRESGVKI